MSESRKAVSSSTVSSTQENKEEVRLREEVLKKLNTTTLYYAHSVPELLTKLKIEDVAKIPGWINRIRKDMPKNYGIKESFYNGSSDCDYFHDSLLFLMKQPYLAETLFTGLKMITPQNRYRISSPILSILTSQPTDSKKTEELGTRLQFVYSKISPNLDSLLPIIFAYILNFSKEDKDFNFLKKLTLLAENLEQKSEDWSFFYGGADKLKVAAVRNDLVTHMEDKKLDQLNIISKEVDRLCQYEHKSIYEYQFSLTFGLLSLYDTSLYNAYNIKLLTKFSWRALTLAEGEPIIEKLDGECFYINSKQELKFTDPIRTLAIHSIPVENEMRIAFPDTELPQDKYDLVIKLLLSEPLPIRVSSLEEEKFTGLSEEESKTMWTLFSDLTNNKVPLYGIDMALVLNYLKETAPTLLTDNNFASLCLCIGLYPDILKDILQEFRNTSPLDQMKFDEIINAHFNTPGAILHWIKETVPVCYTKDFSQWLQNLSQTYSPLEMTDLVKELKKETTLSDQPMSQKIFDVVKKHIHATNHFPADISGLITTFRVGSLLSKAAPPSTSPSSGIERKK